MLCAMNPQNYFRSCASLGVRLALERKGLAYAYVAFHLARDAHNEPVFPDHAACVR